MVRYVYQDGVDFTYCLLFLSGLNVLFVPVTFFVLPKDRINPESLETPAAEEEAKKNAHNNNYVTNVYHINTRYYNSGEDAIEEKNKSQKVESGNYFPKFTQIQTNEGKRDEVNRNSINAEPQVRQIPLRESFFSLPFMLHLWTYAWLISYPYIYVGTMSLWFERMPDGSTIEERFSKIYAFSQLSNILIAPFAGFIIDCKISKAQKEKDPFLRRLKTVQSGFLPLMMAITTAASIITTKFFDEELAIYVSIGFITLLRSFHISICSAYLRVRYDFIKYNNIL